MPSIDIKNPAGKYLETDLGNIQLTEFLGRGKSGYSYLGKLGDSIYTVKFMHNEPCAYYAFGENNKVELEVQAYRFLNKLHIPLPELITYNPERNFLVKAFIEGVTAPELIAAGKAESVIEQLYRMSNTANDAGINLDYFPANFVASADKLYYIDYEYNEYQTQWDLYNWGIYYWANSRGMKQYLKTGDILNINQSFESGRPIKHSLEAVVETWNNRYCGKKIPFSVTKKT